MGVTLGELKKCLGSVRKFFGLFGSFRSDLLDGASKYLSNQIGAENLFGRSIRDR